MSSHGTSIARFAVSVLGLDADLDDVGRRHRVARVFVAIGDHAARSAVTHRCDAVGLPSATAISHPAIVSRSTALLDGVALMPGSVVNAAASIGRGRCGGG